MLNRDEIFYAMNEHNAYNNYSTLFNILVHMYPEVLNMLNKWK